ncbi:DUF998 domain-containing protein [Fulvimarina sp. MAC3]|uniref:DUF998 domain-containing protein n=1 Tax=Fulvimarina sp. MAC3 TaxID=3148887 RepID=UPI0031FD727D
MKAEPSSSASSTASQGKASSDDPSHPKLFYWCGVVGICGCVIVVIANFAALAVLPNVGVFEGTISDTAAGRMAWVMDSGLYAFAIGMIAGSIGLRRLHFGHIGWSVGSWLLMLVAIMIMVIGAYGEYGDNDVGGLVIHLPLVVAMALTFTATALSTAYGFYHYERRWFWFNIVCAVLWVGGAAIFWFSPTSIDGFIERGVGFVCVIWLFALSKLLIDRSRGVKRTLPV